MFNLGFIFRYISHSVLIGQLVENVRGAELCPAGTQHQAFGNDLMCKEGGLWKRVACACCCFMILSVGKVNKVKFH